MVNSLVVKLLRGITFLGIMLIPFANATAEPSPLIMKIYSRQVAADLRLDLSDDTWRWLGQKKILTVATWAPQNQPLDIALSPDVYKGISADYLNIVIHQLGVPVRVLRFASITQALNSLESGESDMMIDDHGSESIDQKKFSGSLEYMADVPVLVSKEINENTPPPNSKNVFRLAVAKDYLSDKQINLLFPHAHITRYPSTASAMSALAYENYDYLLGNMANASFLIDRNYNNSLSIQAVYPAMADGSRFIVRKSNIILLQAVNAVLTAIPQHQKELINESWYLGADLTYLQQPDFFTENEREWIKRHPVVNVFAEPLYAPFTMMNSSGGFHGISMDFLHLISLRTGLQFHIVVKNNISEMIDSLANSEGSMLAAINYSPELQNRVIFTQPYLFAPFVLIVRNASDSPKGLADSSRVAVVNGNLVEERYRSKYPRIHWISADTATQAVKMVDDGEADAAVQVQTGAVYIIDRYFPGRLKIAGRVGEETATFTFGVNKDQRELENILNKTLNMIPPRTYAKIFNKWQGSPEVPLQTWRLYNTQYAIMFFLGAVLFLSSLAWGSRLRRAMKINQKIQSALISQLNFSETLLDGTPTPVYVVNQHGEVTSRNRAYDLFFQVIPTPILELSLFDQRHPLSHVFLALQADIHTSEAKNGINFKQQFTISDGVEKRIVAHWASKLGDTERQGEEIICGWNDITSLHQLMAELSDEKSRAELHSQAKGEFLSTMSHEIRTPVSAVIGLLELADTSRNAPTAEGEALRLAYSSAQSLIELIGDVLDMAKIESGMLKLSPQWVQPVKIGSSAISIFDGLAKQKGLTLRWETTIQEDIEVFIDAQRLRQLLNNYLSNAVKFTNSGEVSLVLTGEPFDGERMRLRILIRDTGIGISEEDMKKLFRPFRQLEAGLHLNGSGLGLFISADLLKIMGGTFLMNSQPGEGTSITLTFTLPFRETVFKLPALSIQPQMRERVLHVLIVDDHATNRLLLERQLLRLGCSVASATNGNAALDAMETAQIDLIITDCQMPVMDGKNLARAVRRKGKNTVIWGLTANAQEQERKECIDAGMNACFFKPLRMEQLSEALERLKLPTGDSTLLEGLINIDSLQQLALNEPGLMDKMLNQTLEENRLGMEMLRSAVAAENWAECATILHKIVGGAQLIQSKNIEEMAGAIEEQVLEGPEPEVIQMDLLRLEKDIICLDNAIIKYLQKKEH